MLRSKPEPEKKQRAQPLRHSKGLIGFRQKRIRLIKHGLRIDEVRNCNGGRPQGPHPAIEPYCPRKTQKNGAQVVKSRGKPLPKTIHLPWKAAAKNGAQVVKSRGKPLPKTMHKSWKAAALIGGTKLSKNSG